MPASRIPLIGRVLAAAGNATKRAQPLPPGTIQAELFDTKPFSKQRGEQIEPVSYIQLLPSRRNLPPLLKFARGTQDQLFIRKQLPEESGTYWLVWGNGEHGGVALIKVNVLRPRWLGLMPGSLWRLVNICVRYAPYYVQYATLTSGSPSPKKWNRFEDRITKQLLLPFWTPFVPATVHQSMSRLAPKLHEAYWPDEQEAPEV